MTDRVERGEPVTAAGKALNAVAWHLPRCAFARGVSDCDCGLTRLIRAIEADARQPLLDALKGYRGQARTIRAEIARLLRDNRPVDMGTLEMWKAGLRAAISADAAKGWRTRLTPLPDEVAQRNIDRETGKRLTSDD